MVNLRDPAVQVKEYDSFRLFMHMLLGAYLWDYVKYIKFDIDLLRSNEGRTQWAKYTYLTCRNIVLVHTALELALYASPTENNCVLLSRANVVTLYVGVSLSSVLIGFRVVAIWNKNIGIFISVVAALIIEFGFFVFSMVKVGGLWTPESETCGYQDVPGALPSAILIAVCDFFLVFVMLSGLLRRRQTPKLKFWTILWNQGLLWLTLVALAEIPTIVMIRLNFSTILDVATVPPEHYIVAMGAMYLYRSLHLNTKGYKQHTTLSLDRPEVHLMVNIHRNTVAK